MTAKDRLSATPCRVRLTKAPTAAVAIIAAAPPTTYPDSWPTWYGSNPWERPTPPLPPKDRLPMANCQGP